MCDINFDGCSEVWDERTVMARKTHVCSCCGGAIRPGDRYVRHFSIYEGDVISGKVCPACETLREQFAEEHGGASFTPSYMAEMLEHCIDEGDENAIRWKAALAAMAGRKNERLVWEGTVKP